MNAAGRARTGSSYTPRPMRQLFEYHPTIAYRFIPGLKVRVEHESGGYLVRTNSTGFRCEREFTPAKAPGTRRVLVFGDSFTAGDGVSNPKRYTDVLETLVPDLEVFNFGLSGTGTDQQYLVWREFARGIEADAVVMTVCVENIRRVNSKFRPYIDDKGEEKIYAKPYFEPAGDGVELRGVPVAREPLTKEELEAGEDGVAKTGRFAGLRVLVNKLGLRDIAQKVTGYQPLPEYDDAASPDWGLMRAVIKKWVGEVDLPVILMPWPVLQYVEETASSENCRARYRELDAEIRASRGPKGAFVLHDMLPDLWKYSAPERRAMRFPGADIHPTPSGHEAVARSLAPVVERVLESR